MWRRIARRCYLLLILVSCLTPLQSIASEANAVINNDAIEDFVMNDGFLKLGQEYYEESKVAFALYYELAQNEPLLIVSNGASSASEIDYYVFSSDHNGQISYACTLEGPIHSMYYFEEPGKYTGFFCSKIIGENYDTIYLTFDGNRLNTQRVSSLYLGEYNGQTDKLTEDSDLYLLSINATGRKEIMLYTKSDLNGSKLNGWSDLQKQSPNYKHRDMVFHPLTETTEPNIEENILTTEPEIITQSPTSTTITISTTTQTPAPEVITPYLTASPSITPNLTQIPDFLSTPETIQGETIKAKVNVREQPSKSSLRVTMLPRVNTLVTITGSIVNADGEKWYQIQTVEGLTGFVRSDFLSIDGDEFVIPVLSPEPKI